MASKFIAQAATEFNVSVAAAVLFVSQSVLARTNAMLLSGGEVVYGPDFLAFAGHYSAEDVMAASGNLDESYSFLLLVASIVNVASILAFAFLASAIVAWAAASLGDRAIKLRAAAVFPAMNGFVHCIEAVALAAALIYDNADLASTAASLSRARIVVATSSLLLSAVAFLWFGITWMRSIGRDGRQRIPVPGKKEEVKQKDAKAKKEE
ncbi:hypothetical protein BC830DRAFT_1079475 [Chytriomyces sp. MP71]|nr:hypothetical protein BC830DRAFT_1079475 [Chytriomyces sp. MP71]